jgi:hypothetical protein
MRSSTIRRSSMIFVVSDKALGGGEAAEDAFDGLVLEEVAGTFPLFVLFLLFSLDDMCVTRVVTAMSSGLVTDMSLGAGDRDVTRGLVTPMSPGVASGWELSGDSPKSIERLAFWGCQDKARVALVLHPRMPEKAVVVCTMAALGIAEVCYGNEPVSGKLPNKPHYVPAGAMQFLRQQPE